MERWGQEIAEQAKKLIARFESYARQLSDEYKRRQRRTTSHVDELQLLRPSYWSSAEGFDPYLVRARVSRIAHAIQSRLSGRSYSPRNAIIYKVPKIGGGVRDVSVFQVADNAVSRRIFQQLMAKNRPRLSSRAYAYRDDLTVHDAIQYVSGEIQGLHRGFLAEYDFSKYFENISHDCIWRVLQDQKFLITPVERNVIKGFLSAPGLNVEGYVESGGAPRTHGVPQGTSISLFLANVAAWELDRALERLGVSFVRYADDTLIWSPDYGQTCRAVEVLYDMAERIGSPLNLRKSGGVRLLVDEGAPAEVKSTTWIDYLGHRVTSKSVSVKLSLITKIKSRINQMIYFNLLREPERGTQQLSRLTDIDRDYVTYIWQLRRYLYGDVSEKRLRRFRARGVPPRRFRGMMSFFPLVNNEEQLEALDKWLLCQTCMALRKRGSLLRAMGASGLPEPHGLDCADLANHFAKSGVTGQTVDIRIPSFRRMAHVIRAAATRYGPNRIARAPEYQYE